MKKILSISKLQQTRNFLIYGIGQGFNLVTPLLVIPYIISVCGLANYGKAAFAMALMFFLMVFVDFGSDIAGVKAVATNRENRESLQQLLVTTYCAKSVMLLLVLAVMSLIILIVPFFEDQRLLFFLSLPILLGQLLNPTWFLQGIENFTQITIINIASKLLYVAGIFLFVHGRGDYVLVNLLWGVGMIVTNLASVIYVVIKHDFSLSGARYSDIKAHLVQGFPIFSSQIFVAVQLYSPLILVGLLGSSLLAGTYRVVDQVIVIFKTYLLLFFNFIFPRVCYLIATDKEAGIRHWCLFNVLNFIFVSGSMACLFFFAEPVARFFTQTDVASIVALLRIGVWIPVLMAISVPMKQLVLSLDNNRFYVVTTVVLVIINTAAIVLLLPIFGIRGVLYALIATELLFAIVFFAKIKNKLFLHRI